MVQAAAIPSGAPALSPGCRCSCRSCRVLSGCCRAVECFRAAVGLLSSCCRSERQHDNRALSCWVLPCAVGA
eukprot:5919157-Prymnesium_polylepis.1